MEISLEGKRALVTGGSRGIGKAIVKQLLKCGADVVAVAKTPGNLAALKKELPNVTTVVLDLAGDWSHIRDTIKSLGVFDLVVSNAGIYLEKSTADATEEDITKMFKTNFFSHVNVCKLTAQDMAENGKQGAIVTIASIGGLTGGPFGFYTTMNAAVIQFTQNMAFEFGPKKIRTNCVCPGITNTEMKRDTTFLNEEKDHYIGRIPLRRFAEPEDISNVVVFLLSDLSRMVNGAILPVDGGHICHM